MKPLRNSLRGSFFNKVLIFTLGGRSAFYSKELKEKYKNNSPNINPKRNPQTLKIFLSLKIKFKTNDNKSITKYLWKTAFKTYKNLQNCKMIKKKSHFGFQNCYFLTKPLKNLPEPCRKLTKNALTYLKSNFG